MNNNVRYVCTLVPQFFGGHYILKEVSHETRENNKVYVVCTPVDVPLEILHFLAPWFVKGAEEYKKKYDALLEPGQRVEVPETRWCPFAIYLPHKLEQVPNSIKQSELGNMIALYEKLQLDQMLVARDLMQNFKNREQVIRMLNTGAYDDIMNDKLVERTAERVQQRQQQEQPRSPPTPIQNNKQEPSRS